MADSIKTQYESRLLARAVPRFIHGKWGEVARLSKFGSYEVRRYSSMANVTSALTEGQTPGEATQPTITKLTLTPALYGSWLAWSDEVEWTAMDPILSEYTGIMGEQAGSSMDAIVRDALHTGATVDYAGTATQRNDVDTTNDLLDYTAFIRGVVVLENANALPAEGEMIPVVISPYGFGTLMNDADFVDLFTRADPAAMRNGYVGNILNCRVYVTSNAKTYAGEGDNCDVHTALFIGRQSHSFAGFANAPFDYANGDSGGERSNNTMRAVKPVEVIIKGLGETGLDPLNQRGTIGWKLSHTQQVLNSAWLLSMEHASIF
jgi:N4-gp56 family major capsid protein